MAITSNALDGLLYIRIGYQTSRWNFPDAVGTPLDAPGGIGNAVSLSYSFLNSLPSYSSETGFQVFDSSQKQATRTVLSSIEALIDVDFTEVSGVGQMTFAMSSQSAGQGGYAYTPSFSYSYGTNISSVTEMEIGGDVWLNSNATRTAGEWAAGHDGYATLLHEIGHALGLKHPFDGSNTLSVSLDNESHTVMSYTQAPNSKLIAVTGDQWSYSWITTHLRPSTLMPLDIEALQYLYGANTTTRTGNDVYRWSLNAELLETIWDSSGTDTIDCANQTLTCIIDLRAGNYSSIALRQSDAEKRVGLELPTWFSVSLPADVYNGSNNLAIAKGVVIEKALGGSGNDQLIGNDASNSLIGGAGSDSLAGGLGNDSIDGGIGIDTMTGGDGNDYYYVRDVGDSVSETNATTSSGGNDTVYSYLNGYTLTSNVEYGRIMSAGTASLIGNMLNNVLYAGQGSNVIAGGDGIDTASFYYGVTGTTGVTASLLTGQATGSGSDTLTSIERVYGSNNADRFTGDSKANHLYGYAGNDTLDGGTGIDTLVGGDGSDYYYVRDIGDSVSETNAAITGGTDTVYCYLASYTLSNNVENGRIMSTGLASLSGNTLNNVLYAGQGNNVIAGGDGIDAASFYYGVTGTTGVTASLVTGQATGSGSDTLIGIERLYGSKYTDRFIGDAKANYLYGYAGNDTLDGGAGIDTLVGGEGRDSLTGGLGNDIFDFNLLSEMGLATDSNTWDVITDFRTGDRIDLSSLDANATNTVGSNDAFSSSLVSTFTAAGQLKFDNVAHVLYGNTDSNLTNFELAIKLTGVNTLATADFVL